MKMESFKYIWKPLSRIESAEVSWKNILSNFWAWNSISVCFWAAHYYALVRLQGRIDQFSPSCYEFNSGSKGYFAHAVFPVIIRLSSCFSYLCIKDERGAGVCCGPCNPSKWEADIWGWLEVCHASLHSEPASALSLCDSMVTLG